MALKMTVAGAWARLNWCEAAGNFIVSTTIGMTKPLPRLRKDKIGLAIEVHRHTGAGLLESLHATALDRERECADIRFRHEACIPAPCNGDSGFRQTSAPMPGARDWPDIRCKAEWHDTGPQYNDRERIPDRRRPRKRP
jgi:hypothetical protein